MKLTEKSNTFYKSTDGYPICKSCAMCPSQYGSCIYYAYSSNSSSSAYPLMCSYWTPKEINKNKQEK